MNLNKLIYHPHFLTERGKVSKQLLDQAASSGMTFGFESEFYVQGVWELFRSYLAKNTRQTPQGQVVKPVTSLRWHDLVVYFEPVALTSKELIGGDNEEIKLRRLTFAYRKLTQDETPASPDVMFEAVKKHFGAGGVLMVLGLFPTRGFSTNSATNRSAEDRIKEFRTSPSKALLDSAKNFTYMSVLMASNMDEFDDSLSFGNESPKRQVVLEMLGKIVSDFLGAPVATTLNPNSSSEVSEGYSKWTLTVDESLKRDDALNTIGLELISPVSDINTGFENVGKVFTMLKNFGAITQNKKLSTFTTDETGFHVNLGVGKRKIDVVKLLFLLDDDYVLKKFQREDNAYTRNSFASMIQKIRANPTNMDGIVQTIEKGVALSNEDVAHILGKLKQSVEVSKMMTVNLSKLAKHRFVEFRSMGNANYEDRITDVLQSVKTFATMMYAATDPEVYRQEYLSKVFRVIRSIGEHYREPLPSFGPSKDVLALVDAAQAAPVVKVLQRGERNVARSYMDLNAMLNGYKKTGRLNVPAFKNTVNALVNAVLKAKQSGALPLGKAEQQALRSYVEMLKKIATSAKPTMAQAA